MSEERRSWKKLLKKSNADDREERRDYSAGAASDLDPKTASGLAIDLFNCFHWADTAEGHDFWQYVYDRLQYIGANSCPK